MTCTCAAFAAPQSIVIGKKVFKGDLTVSLKNMEGMEERETSNTDDGDATLIINTDVSDLYSKIVNSPTLDLTLAKNVRNFSLFEAQKDILISNIEIEKTVEYNSNEQVLKRAYAWVSKDCYVALEAYDSQEPGLKAKSALVRKGEVLVAYRGFDSNYTDKKAKKTFRIELLTPGHVNPRSLTCYEPINKDSSVQDLVNATDSAFKVAP